MGVDGQPITIQITVSNDGPNDATGASLPITLPPGFELVSTTPGQGGFDRETGVWSIGTLAARGSVVLELLVDPTSVGAAEFVAGPARSDVFDPSTADDTATADVTITAVSAPSASLSGTVFDDLNNDGIREKGESGAAGVTIILDRIDTESSVVQPAATELEQLTSADGTYSFTDLPAGTYSISTPDSFGIPGTLGGEAQSGRIWAITLADGQHGVGYDFADHPVGTATTGEITGQVYLDRNRNGKDDAGTDPGTATIGVVLVGVDDSGHSVRLVTHTQAEGTFVFDDLQPGTYSIRAPRSVEFRDFRSNVGTAGGTVVHHAIENITIHAGTVAQDYDFGKLPKPGCRLDSWMGRAGARRLMPRGPLTAKFFPTLAAAKHHRPALHRAMWHRAVHR